jgi:ankyrin repeat protein
MTSRINHFYNKMKKNLDVRRYQRPNVQTDVNRYFQLMLETQTATDGFDLDPINCQGQTPLLLAVQSGNADLVSFLIEVGSNAHHSDLNGNNALHLAAAASVRWFVRHRGGVVDQTLQMSSATAYAEQREMVDLLISYGVSMRQRNRHGLTPVRLAALLGSDECARRMLKRIFVKSGLIVILM